jgi:hypothetical protein
MIYRPLTLIVKARLSLTGLKEAYSAGVTETGSLTLR